MSTDSSQQKHYDSISDLYAAHYDDSTSFEYRKRFMYSKMFKGIDVKNKTVLDGMCGAGGVSKYLRPHTSHISGLDISEQMLAAYKSNNPDLQIFSSSITKTPFENNTFDLITIVGGLHHVHPDVQPAIQEIHRILKPNGYFICFEPPKFSFLNIIRMIWYKFDRYFEENEEAIDVTSLVQNNKHLFEVVDITYGGGPAYFIILNSLVLRIPLGFKKFLAKILFPIDSIVESLLPKILSSYVVIRLKKKL